jgi:hypothetical protein
VQAEAFALALEDGVARLLSGAEAGDSLASECFEARQELVEA